MLNTSIFSLSWELQLAADLKAKAAMLETEVWGHFCAALTGAKVAGFWDLMESLLVSTQIIRRMNHLPPAKKARTKDVIPSTNKDTASAEIL